MIFLRINEIDKKQNKKVEDREKKSDTRTDISRMKDARLIDYSDKILENP